MKHSDTGRAREAVVSAGFRPFYRAFNDKRIGGRRIKIWIDTSLKHNGNFSEAVDNLEKEFGSRLKGVTLITEREHFALHFFPSIQVFLWDI